MTATATSSADAVERTPTDSVIIRFAGDSGDGMQLTGSQFTQSTALMGNDLATFPDYPAEIRAPAGTTYGVSAFQIHFADHDIATPGDAPDVLVAMNPAALQVSLADQKPNGMIVVNTGSFTKNNLKKAGYEISPLEDGSLDAYQVMALDISKFTVTAVEEFGLSTKDALRAKNMWTLGLMYWMYGRDRQSTIDWLRQKFVKRPEVAESNIAALNAGHIYGQVAELPSYVIPYEVNRASLAPGEYRNIMGSQALAWGLTAGAKLAGLVPMLGSYPITPASSTLHELAKLKHFGVVTFQAEDEIAAVCAAIGASYGGALGMTSSSGPGVALKMEAIGLAVGTELPLIILNVQRGGPSTGLPTKTEQSDLLQMMYGRNGDSPAVIISASTPSDCFDVAIEACRLATQFMTPVFIMSDGYLANGSEPWLLPNLDDYAPFPANKAVASEGFHPFLRDPETLARNWPIPGTVGLQHRIGGLEKDYDSGNVSYDPDNHQRMTDVRHQRIAQIADHIPEQSVTCGVAGGRLALVSWGSTYGAVFQAVKRCRARGLDVSQVHIRHLNPFPTNLGDLISGYDQLLVPELNAGQLVKILRSEF
ncbi:MAG: 2-oxoacid:acceptor oxidoreductase subunit alpha, partial [Myxococcota bacterium]|nr:2-oxoacid:acceptor oxidoreductase subunit alpha [Myxococcota bacterium]